MLFNSILKLIIKYVAIFEFSLKDCSYCNNFEIIYLKLFVINILITMFFFLDRCK